MSYDPDRPVTPWQGVKALFVLLVILAVVANVFVARVYPGHPNGLAGFWHEHRSWTLTPPGGEP